MTFEEYLKLSMNVEFNFKKTKSGNCSIETTDYPAGSKLAVIPSNYESYLKGLSYKVIQLEQPFTCYNLYDGDEIIMLNSGIEIYNQYIPYLKAKGNVLIGGLGLGLLSRLLCEKEGVSKVTSIEYNEDVITLCGFEHEKSEIIHGDFFAYIRNNDLTQFDYIYIDTHSNNDVNNYYEMIIPTKNYLLENYPTIPVDFWMEDQFKALYLLEKYCKSK